MKVIKLVLVAMLIVGMAGVAQAGILGDTLTDAKDGPVKVAIVYNFDSNQTSEGIGGAVNEDIFDIENLDYDILIVSEKNSTLANDEKVVLNQVSYNYNFNDKLSAFAGLGVGISRVEKLESHRLGEMDKYASVGFSYRF